MDTERLYREREKRVKDAVALKVPDRVSPENVRAFFDYTTEFGTY